MARLDEGNYYSLESNREYWSVSQYKSFVRCEAAAMAQLSGEWQCPTTDAMLMGLYLDNWMDGTLDVFRERNPSIFTRQGSLKAEYRRAEDAIRRISSDGAFMRFISGEHQKILTFSMFGVPWKVKYDSFHEGICIVDLKYVRSFESLWKFRYDIQGAVYVEAARANGYGGLPFYLAAVTKDEVPDFDVFQVRRPQLDAALAEVGANMGRFRAVKEGLEEPAACGSCAYCRTVKKSGIRDFMELVG